MSARIMVVDDEEHFRKLVAHFLEMDGHEVEEVDSPEEVLTRVEKKSYDLILLDVSMPHINGFQLAAMLREKRNFHRMPIVFLTAHQEVEDKLLAFNLGASDYIAKPFNGEELRARVAALLREKTENREDQENARIETLSQLMITLAHYINNSLMTMMGRALVTEAGNEEMVEELKHSVMKNGEKIKAVVGLLREMADKKAIKTADYVGLHGAMFDIQTALDEKMSEVEEKYPSDNGSDDK